MRLLLVVLLSLPTLSFADPVNVQGTIDSVVPRASGLHSVFLRTSVNDATLVSLDQGCQLADRAVLDLRPGNEGLQPLWDVLLAASGLAYAGATVELRIDGCIETDDLPSSPTAARLTKVKIILFDD